MCNNRKLLKMKLQQEDIEKLESYKSEYNQIISELGQIEFDIQSLHLIKENLKQRISELKIKEKEIANDIQVKYGEGSIDLEKKEFAPIK